MKSILVSLCSIGLALSSVFTCAAAPLNALSCDAAFVAKSGNVITVRPTGTDDTANLQCAFDTAVASGARMDIQLKSGTYYTKQVVANGFRGRWQGAGAHSTNIINRPNLYVTPVNPNVLPPSASNPNPILFAFVDGDFAISGMAIHIIGDTPTTGWSIMGSPTILSMAAAIMIEGVRANANVDNVLVTGEKSSDPLFGYNVYNGVVFQGFLGNMPPPPLSGSFKLTNSSFQTVASASPVSNLVQANIQISHNKYQDVMLALEGGDLDHSQLEYFDNNILSAVVGFNLYDSFSTIKSSKVQIRNNTFRGTTAIDIEATFTGKDNQCLIVGNNVKGVGDPAIILGPGAKGCRVVGYGPGTSVLNNGKDNVLEGVKVLGTGNRPAIHSPLQLFKK